MLLYRTAPLTGYSCRRRPSNLIVLNRFLRKDSGKLTTVLDSFLVVRRTCIVCTFTYSEPDEIGLVFATYKHLTCVTHRLYNTFLYLITHVIQYNGA